MSHLPLSLMNRLNKTESAVFKLWMLYFQRLFFQIICLVWLCVFLIHVSASINILGYGIFVQKDFLGYLGKQFRDIGYLGSVILGYGLFKEGRT